jgi:hypothetical protein
VLDLGSNRLTGGLPPGLGRNGALRELHVDNNSLAGPLPAGVVG